MQSFAEIQELSIALHRNKGILSAVDKISFNLISGETLALLGESGCGKSLTALALMRLLPPYALYGSRSSIDIDGQDILDLPESMMQQLRGRKLAMIFQEPMTALNPVLTIRAQLAECFDKNLSKNQLEQAMLASLKEVELPNPALQLMQYPHQLSGGQKQRVVIAMALASHPDILIADEPTTALDVTIQAQILSLLKRLQQRYRMSLLLITHDLGVVKAMADSVCVMYAGQIVEYAKSTDFFKKVLHPYSMQLLASLPAFEKRGQLLQVLPGSVPALDARPSGCRFHTRCAYAFDACRTEEPVLQGLENRTVRCHLYPENQYLPAINKPSMSNIFESVSGSEILKVTNLSVQFIFRHGVFKQKKVITKAVDEISFTLKKGETLALVGESGSGKTTIGRALSRLIPWTGGEVLFEGQHVKTLKGKALQAYRKKVQIIFQDPFSSMNPRMTVGEILAEGMHVHNMTASKIYQNQIQLLDQVQLPKNSLHLYPHQFSGGQRQRICIARALAMKPEILICDEPTSALDVSVQAQILNLLKTLQQETGLAYLFITHNMEVVSWIADNVLVMRAGKMVEQGALIDVFKEPKQEYTKDLLNALLHV